MARRKAERLAIQTGSGRAPEEKGVSFSSGVQGLIERTIRTEELASGKPLSEERKAQIAAKVRALAPAEGVRGHLKSPPSCTSHALPPITELAFFSVYRKAPARRRRASLTDRRAGHMQVACETSQRAGVAPNAPVWRFRGVCQLAHDVAWPEDEKGAAHGVVVWACSISHRIQAPDSIAQQ